VTRKIRERIERELGMPGLTEALAKLPASDLQSLLLEVMRNRPAAPFATDAPLLAPSSVEARQLNLFERVAFECATGFEAITLAPVTPAGIYRELGGIDTNNVLSTIRNVEVVADSTVGQMLECARRRRDPKSRTTPVHLCGSHRCMRLQKLDFPGFTPHFQLFSLVSAGRDSGSFQFESDALHAHLGFYLRLFAGLTPHGFRFADPVVEISDTEIVSALVDRSGIDREELRRKVRPHQPGSGDRFVEEHKLVLPTDADLDRDLADFAGTPAFARLRAVRDRVFPALAQEFPGVRCRFNLSRLEGLGYYQGLCLRAGATAPDGMPAAPIDGGFVDWTQRVLNDRKERLLASGTGSEFICKKYRV
jgi:hypothetical protein